jgi:GTP-binding protein
VSQFVDECSIHVKAGDGGAGCVAFRREAHVPRGGPDGGDGGKGGDVWLVADRNIASLLSFKDRPFRRADDGVHGKGKRRHGRAGEDLLVPVPEGTTVADQDGDVLADLVAEGDRYLIAEGGRGGHGNARFLSNKRRVPGFAEQGETGEEHWRRLELKLVADVALVGFPNVGKSTLISRISAAKPKIADYPFTTLEPNLGVVRLDELEYVVADVPGLIEGAAEGKGLGHRFLRHVERARVLCVLLDVADPASGVAVTGLSPAEQLDVLLAELDAYQPDLVDRPRLVVGSRADLLEVASADVPGVDLLVSAVTGSGIPKLQGELGDTVRAARADVPTPSQFVVHRPVPKDVSVEREDSGWVVHGREARRAVALSDLTRADALAEAHRRLKALGVDRALARAGVRPGETVRIGGLVFDYADEQIVR